MIALRTGDHQDSTFPGWWQFIVNTNRLLTSDRWHPPESQCQTSVWSWSLHCKIRVTSIIGDWQLVSWARDQGQVGRGNDRGQFISGVRIFVFTGREHDVTSPYHAAASSPDWSGWKLSIEVHMIPWYPMSLPASVIPCVLCTILMDIILNKGDCRAAG